MRILVAGALGEVGSSVSSVLEHLGYEVVRASGRAPIAGSDVLGLSAAAEMVRLGSVDLVVNAAGRGDRRSVERSGIDATSVLAPAIESVRTPGVLLSTTRVLEGWRATCSEDAKPNPATPYAESNARNESDWIRLGGESASIVRITNFFAAPMGRQSPQSQLLPWSLLDEGLRTGAINVRSSATTSREFVSASDVAQAAILHATTTRGGICATAPGLSASLADLATACSQACVRAGLPAPSAHFGSEVGVTTKMEACVLAEQGWRSSLSLEHMVDVMATWIEETSSE